MHEQSRPPRLPGASAAKVVEFPVLNTGDNRGASRRRVDQRGTGRVARVANGNGAAGEFGYLDAASVRVAVGALAPADSRQPGGWHAVVSLKLRHLSDLHSQHKDARAPSVTFNQMIVQMFVHSEFYG